MLGIESIKQILIIEAKTGQNGRRSKCTTIYKLSVLARNSVSAEFRDTVFRGKRNWDSHRIMIDIDCNRIKVSLD